MPIWVGNGIQFEIEGRRRWNTELVINNEGNTKSIEDDLITDKLIKWWNSR